MGTTSPIGILLERRTLLRALAGRRTLEQVALYREIALSEPGIAVVLFSEDGINLSRHRVRGYAPTRKGWRRVIVPVPRVVHKRVLFRVNAPLKKLARLRRRGTRFVNPHLIQNKARMNDLLAGDEVVRAHLPRTHPYRRRLLEAMLDAGQGAILKPRIGSVGQGIVRIEPTSDGKARLTTRTTRVLSARSLRRYLGRAVSPKRYLLQEYLALARFEERPFDLRVPVQRDGRGEWTVPGMVAKVAGKHPFLTNLAQGGRAVPGETAIAGAFAAPRAAEVIDAVKSLAVHVAEAVGRTHPLAADLGLDIGVDREGKPWLIEVNTRDQRITFLQAGLHDQFRTLYKNPLEYCSLLLAESE